MSLRWGAALAAAVALFAGARNVCAQTPAPTTGFQDGFFIQSANGDNRIVFGITAQADGRFVLDDPKPITNTFTIRKLRPTLTGRIARYFDFKFMPDFGNGAASLQDAYFDVRFSPKLRVRTGKEKTPFGYEMLVGDPYVLFPERSLATGLVPNRDVGVAVMGDLTPRFFYTAGVYNGVPDGASSTGDVDTNQGKDLVGRVVVRPAGGLGVHLAGSTGAQSGALPVFKTSVGQTYFSYAAGSSASGRRTRVTPAVFYYYKSLGLFGEYVRSTQEVARSGSIASVTNDAWQITGAVMLTGEAATDRIVRPAAGFDPDAGHWGALQLVARAARLRVDDAAFDARLANATASGEATAVGLGLNWYPSAYVKYYLAYEHTAFGGPHSGGRADENSVTFRAQVAF